MNLSYAALGAIAALAIGTGTATPAAAQTYEGPVAVVVAVPIPAGLTRPAIEAQFQKLAPTYRAVPELKQKYFTVNGSKAGGIYLWTSRAAADAFYNEAWHQRVLTTYGAPAEVTFFDAPLVIQGRAGMAGVQ